MAERISAYDPQPRDAKAVGRARAAVITAFGRTLSGAPDAITKALLATPGVAVSGGSSLVFGTERRTSAVDAALINAAAAVAGSTASPDAANGAFVVSLFGLCEERGKTGQEFIDALIAGAEISRSLAPALSPPAGQLGLALLGSVAAAGRLLGLSPSKIAAALLMAGVANAGTPAAGQGGPEALMVGQSLRNGLLAALLAEAMDEASCNQMIEAEQCAAGGGLLGAEALDLLAVPSPPGADLWDQFDQQAGAILPRDDIAPLFERLETIDKVKDLTTVSRLLQGRGARATPKKVVFAPRGTHEPEETNWVP
ncbi:MmgE/PrpD family protein [Bradyrhizobium liaoningense]|uniref:MmgE/PrpD family protein n=1 Tax=Bradyrhizobium liaoningense TaxID=43992 RepID=UPI001BA53156|nr:MmgE/PrpD family protein [Bradyrhizobium liaoningense]MBR0816639.1 MmgE/PrpD family protein [Bradyrhizobium liaoningense]